jgi:glycosyltransferase involved in cell wall biosynthesis
VRRKRDGYRQRRGRVALDIRIVQQALRNSPEGGLGGPGRYAYELLQSFQDHDETDHVLLVDHGLVPSQISELANRCEHFSLYRVGIKGMPPRLSFGRAAAMTAHIEAPILHAQIRRLKPTLLHLLDQPPPPRLRLHPRIVTAHDVGPLREASERDQSWTLKSMVDARVRAVRAMSSSDVVACSSQATRRDMVDMLKVDPERLSVIYPGIDTLLFTPGPSSSVREGLEFLSQSVYFLHVGVLRDRKNPRKLLEAFRQIATQNGDVHLICVGPYQTSPEAARNVTTTAGELGIEARVHVLGNVSDKDLVQLYRGSIGLVYPSLFEGFGFPVLEALACGAPCVIANNSSLPEVGGDLAIYVDPLDASSISAGMARLLVDQGWRRHIANAGPIWAKKFSWSRTADAFRNLYSQLGAGDGEAEASVTNRVNRA